MNTIKLKCRCGEVQGQATQVSASSGTRVVCCCSDCQAFAHFLDRAADTLDPYGGTDIYQMSQSQLAISQGLDNLQSMRLTPNGLLRWYTRCCNTPIGNTLNAKMPFVGVIHTFMDIPGVDRTLGPVRAYVQTQHAMCSPDYPRHSKKFPLGITARIIRKMLMWKIQGKQKPSVFFTAGGEPVVQPIIAQNQPT